jgi:hypothetical protein
MQENSSIRLVEALFYHHSDMPVAILLKVSDEGSGNQRFNLLNAIFRLWCV